MGTKRVHMCASVRGLLRRPLWELNGMFVHSETRQPMNALAAHDFLCDELAKGHEVIPLADDCEGFDFKTGCPGHIIEEAAG